MKYSKEILRKVAYELYLLGTGLVQPDDIEFGVCSDIRSKYDVSVRSILEKYYPEWGMYSDDHLFPVPHPDMDPGLSYMYCEHLWCGEYGDNRRKFCLWASSKIKELIGE